MNLEQNSFSDPRELVRLVIVHWRRWAAVALAVTAVAVVYALVMPKSWQATQGLIVRSEALVNDADSAKGHSPDELKGIQETIVELVKSPSVLRGALTQVGPPADCRHSSAWPNENDVDNLQKVVKISPPKGVELGTSDVFYLEVRDKDRARALELNKSLCTQLQRQMQDIRDAKAKSMVDELEKAVEVAKSDLRAATARLSAMEKEVGSDLPELRSLLDANSSDTSLHRTITEIENELRQCRTAVDANQQLLNLLEEADADPAQLVAAPSRLLESQPALRRLKEALVDAQIRTATLAGRMSSDHPELIAAAEAEKQVASRLHAELATAGRGVRVELAYAESRVQFLEHQREQAALRLNRMAGLRATYANTLNESANRAKQLERAEQSLALARSNRASAKAASQIATIDGPDTGANPVSPGRSTIVLGGLLGGIAAGIGLVFLTAPVGTKRSADQLSLVQLPAAASRPTTASVAVGPTSVATTIIVPYCATEMTMPLAVTVTAQCD